MKPAEEAFERYHRPVFDFVYRRTMRTDLAEDITQECFLALLKTPERYDASRSSLKTYLFAIARNLTLANTRDNWRESQLDDDFRPPQLLPSSEISVLVQSAVSSLTPLQQEVVILFEYEGLTLEEISAVIQADIGTVKSRLHRARENLKRMLAPMESREDANGAR